MTDTPENISLRLVAADEKRRWDSLVDSSAHGTVFHTWDWVSAMARHAQMRLFGETIKPVFHPLIAEHEGEDVGLIPLYEFRGRFVNYVFSPPPHTAVTYLGPCLNFQAGLKQGAYEQMHKGFQEAVESYLANLGANSVRIRPPPGFDDARPYLWLGYEVTPLYNYVVDLQHPIDEIFQRSEPNFRNKVRRTEKEGYAVREGSFDDVKNLYNQQKTRYDEQGLPTSMTLEYLKDVWENVPPGRLRILVIEDKGEYLSATIEAYYKGRVIGWIGNPKSHPGAGSPNDLLIWEVIKHAVANGHREYENIWANEERLNPFKTKLNPRLNRYYSVVKMNRLLSLAYQVKKCMRGGGMWSA